MPWGAAQGGLENPLPCQQGCTSVVGGEGVGVVGGCEVGGGVGGEGRRGPSA